MIRVCIAWTTVGSTAAVAAVMAQKGSFTDALWTNLRGTARMSRGRTDTVQDDKLGAVWESLLGVAKSSVSEQFHKGLSAPLNQSGYEQSLGNPAMTAFIMHFIQHEGFHILSADALQGFVMYYDGTCHKKAFKNLVEQITYDEQRENCNGEWLRKTSTSMLESTRAVRHQELNAMLLKEKVIMRAAAYNAGKGIEQSADSTISQREFIRHYIDELHGRVINETKLDALIVKFINQESNAQKPLKKLTDVLIIDSESSSGACVKLPPFASRSVMLLDGNMSLMETQASDVYAYGFRTFNGEGVYINKGHYYEGKEAIMYKDPVTSEWKIVDKAKKSQVLGGGPYDASALSSCNIQAGDACEFHEWLREDSGTWGNQSSIGIVGSIGTTAPLDEFGYQLVVAKGNTDEMAKFVMRVARNLSLNISGKTQIIVAFSKWYDGSCAKQSLKALQSELKSMAEEIEEDEVERNMSRGRRLQLFQSGVRSVINRPVACGGGWVSASPSLSQWRSVFKHRFAAQRKRAAHELANSASG